MRRGRFYLALLVLCAAGPLPGTSSCRQDTPSWARVPLAVIDDFAAAQTASAPERAKLFESSGLANTADSIEADWEVETDLAHLAYCRQVTERFRSRGFSPSNTSELDGLLLVKHHRAEVVVVTIRAEHIGHYLIHLAARPVSSLSVELEEGLPPGPSSAASEAP